MRRQTVRPAKLAFKLVISVSPALLFVMSVLTFAQGVIPAATAWFSRIVLNSVTGHLLPLGEVISWAVALGVAGVVSAVLPQAQQYVDSSLRRELGLAMSDRLCQAINRVPGISRFETPECVDRVRLAQESSQSTPNRLVGAVFGTLQGILSAVSFFATLYLISPMLAVVVIAAAVPAIVAQLTLSHRSAGLYLRISPTIRREIFYRGLQTDLAAAKEVRLFGLGDFLRGRMLTELRAINREQQALDRRKVVTQGLLAVLSAAITAVGLVWTVVQASAGRLTVGDVSLFVLAVVGMQGALGAIVSRVADAHESLLLFGHYIDVVSAAPDLPVAVRPVPLSALADRIEVRDVWFRYDENGPWILRGLNLTIERGTSVALVGLNGAGKSSLVKLLCRLYDPNRGSIYWDGVDIRDVDPVALRRRIGAVFQDYMAYDLTVAENIGLGDLNHLKNKYTIECAATRAGIHKDVSGMAEGYNTMLSRVFFGGEENLTIGIVPSGGQWQRIALARGLMRHDRDLLVLDEPSSGLDAQAEYTIHSRLRVLREGRTSLLISHRLGSIRDADLIYVLAGGVIAERGTHADLMALKGKYHHLFTLQGAGYREQAVDEGLNL